MVHSRRPCRGINIIFIFIFILIIFVFVLIRNVNVNDNVQDVYTRAVTTVADDVLYAWWPTIGGPVFGNPAEKYYYYYYYHHHYYYFSISLF